MKNMKSMKVALAVCFSAACTSGPPPPPAADSGAYERTVTADRAQKDAAFRAPDNDGSPIPAAERAAFPGLQYFRVDVKYRVPASLVEERFDPPVVIELPTSINTRRKMRKVGSLKFTLDGTPLALTAFADVDARTPTTLFVPFGDLTNADPSRFSDRGAHPATYKGGRYLDLHRTPTGLYDLDFNRAYHPYCVYNSTYECPVPPRENRLTVAINAGERLGDSK
jgi:uncharacterized protein (DUF1684 family)